MVNFIHDYWPVLLAILFFLPIMFLGVILIAAVKLGTVPSWLKWYNPFTKGKLLSNTLFEKCSKADKIRIDGIELVVVTGVLIIWILSWGLIIRFIKLQFEVFVVIFILSFVIQYKLAMYALSIVLKRSKFIQEKLQNESGRNVR